jgi:hypothetical protein
MAALLRGVLSPSVESLSKAVTNSEKLGGAS